MDVEKTKIGVMVDQERHGFTLVELLTVLGIIGVLVSLLLPGVQAVREASRRTACANKIRQIALALHNYESANQELPPSLSHKEKSFLMNWPAKMLPFLEQKPLSQRVNVAFANGIHPFHQENLAVTVPAFQCPSNPDMGYVFEAETTGFLFAFTDYSGVNGVSSAYQHGVFPDFGAASDRRIGFGDITDGLSNTLAFCERPPSQYREGYGIWLGSQNPLSCAIGVYEEPTADPILEDCEEFGFRRGKRGDDCSAFHPWSFHPSGANFSMADGSVHFVSYEIDPFLLATLSTRNGGEPGSIEDK